MENKSVINFNIKRQRRYNLKYEITKYLMK